MEEARSKGLKFYFLGNKCANGNIAKRKLSNSSCACDDCKKDRSDKQIERNKSPLQKKKNADYFQRVKERNKVRRREYKQRDEIKEREKEMARLRDLNKRKSEGRPAPKKITPQGIIPDGVKLTPKEYARAYYLKNKDKNIKAANNWVKNNKEKRREVAANWSRRSRIENPHISFARKTLSRMGYVGSKTSAVKLLGYSHEEFINHIESMFKSGMTWSNRGEWHIDHIKPISAFNSEGVTDIKIINSLSNLQPLWAKDNLSKGAKY